MLSVCLCLSVCLHDQETERKKEGKELTNSHSLLHANQTEYTTGYLTLCRRLWGPASSLVQWNTRKRLLTPTAPCASKKLPLFWIPQKIFPSTVAVFISRHVASPLVSSFFWWFVWFDRCARVTFSFHCYPSLTGNAKGQFRTRLLQLYHSQFISQGTRLRLLTPVISYPLSGRGGLQQITIFRCFLRKRQKKRGEDVGRRAGGGGDTTPYSATCVHRA